MKSKMNSVLKVLGAILLVTIAGSIPYLAHRCDQIKYRGCKYEVIDSHGYHYYSYDYRVIDKSCIQLIDHRYQRIITCGEYTIKEIKR